MSSQPTIPFGLTPKQRKDILAGLRQLGVSDRIGGDLMQITRERVAQVIGRNHDDETEARDRDKLKAILLTHLRAGGTLLEFAQRHGIKPAHIRYFANQHIQPDEWRDEAKQARIEQLEDDLMEFIEHSGMPFLTTYLIHWDYNLYARAMRHMRIKEWQKHFRLTPEQCVAHTGLEPVERGDVMNKKNGVGA